MRNEQKLAYIISYLTGRAQAWATAEWNRKSAVCNSPFLCTKTFTRFFQMVAPGRDAAGALIALRQSKRSDPGYAIEFQNLAAESSWNQPALADAFPNGLNDSLKDHMATLDLPSKLDALIALASEIDKILFELEKAKAHSSVSTTPSLRPMYGTPSAQGCRPTAVLRTAYHCF